ncbi:N-acetyltransferase family protein [Sphingomonas sp. 28-63-12]|uniref:GNAT family N-acetyltransferase n=1 Tax=Sphingomonas sp. 28-63-12 TaxID=1970434 RepID=UPI0035A96875
MNHPIPATPPVLPLPAALLDDGYRLRAETDADLPFLRALYGSTRDEELAQLATWSGAQKQAFIAQQFDAQRSHYRHYFPNCAFDVIEQHGQPVGRFYLDRRATQLHVIDIALMPQWRGIGLGTAILTALIKTAAQAGLGVGIFVEKFNPALRLYRRLGFVEIADTGVYLEMEQIISGDPGAGGAPANVS